jgi:hypothetical protein
MKEFQNKNHIRRQATETDMEQENPPSAGRHRKFLAGFLFLFVLVCLLGGIVSHYSRYSTDGKFALLTEESGMVSDNEVQIEYQRMLVRNRYPFELTMTAQLCSVDNNAETPRFSVLDKRSWNFTGTRSLYTGTYETRVNIVVSADGQFHVTDSSDKPEVLFNSLTTKVVKWEDFGVIDGELRTTLTQKVREDQLAGVSQIREDQKTYGKEIIWVCSLPGEHPDQVLAITLRLKANYGQ